LGEVAEAGYETILMQGSGTFGIEAVISTVTPPDGKWLFIVNGAYGRRMKLIAGVLGLETAVLEYPENCKPNLQEIDDTLAQDPTITHVATVHCETTTGIINQVEEMGEIVRRYGRVYFVDAMSSFGAIPLNLAQANIDFLVTSANKCIEGVPGFSIVLARRKALLATDSYARSVSLDLLAQWRGLEANGQFRFTPPTHALLAFAQALAELKMEGGVVGRYGRYQQNYQTLITGMRKMGFTEYLKPEDQGPIITSFHYPDHPNFEFNRFYEALNKRNFVIYPGKVSNADCFRIGAIGRIFEADIKSLLAAIADVLGEMGIILGE
ncbi:MAG: 2-aminoethylphosphonate--pyruvate transaminase, partial [Chloroflexi bacterium]|nr:2-aminoethylphosphonate--pyruvate transaminase [Chloroflexota bacterium]